MKSLFVSIWLISIILTTSWFFFWSGMFYLHDYLHTARITEMANGLRDGHFPVRWSEHFGYGYGMPLFQFYAPLPFYIGAVLTMIGIPALAATKALFIVSSIFTTVGSYKLGRILYGRVGGLMVAAAISLAPYRAVNLYVRGALSELWGLMASVWILYFLYQSCKGERYSWIGLTVSLSVLFLSHNLLTLMFVPFSVVIGVISLLYFYYSKKEKLSSLLQKTTVIIVSYLVAIGISAFYLFPAYFEKSFTQVQSIIVGGYFDYSLHFVYLRQFFNPNWGYGGSNWGPDDGISFFLGFAQIITLVLSALSLVYVAKESIFKHTTSISRSKWWWLVSIFGLLVASLLLTTEKSSSLWRLIPLLEFVQFPWRFLSVSAVLIGVVAPIFLLLQHSIVKRWLLGWFFILLFFANAVYFRPQEYIDEPQQFYSADEIIIESELSSVLPDYLPLEASATTPPVAMALCQGQCQIVSVNKDLTHRKEVSVQATEESLVKFSVHYFPGWVAYVDGQPAVVKVENGLLGVTVSPGDHSVAVEFSKTQVRSVSDIISLGSLVVLGLGIVVARQRKDEKTR